MLNKNSLPQNVSIIFNNSQEKNLIDLLAFRNIIKQQLFLMSPTAVTKTLFDRVHQSMILKSFQDNKLIGGICFYQIKKHNCCAIIYFAVKSQFQAKGYGSYLMTAFKKQMRERGHKTLATQADTISLNFYNKNGFIEFPKKSSKLDRQPRQIQLLQDEVEKDAKDKYRRYQPWLDYIQDYYSSVLLFYKIPFKVDYDRYRQIVIKQKNGLIQKISKIKQYRGHEFDSQTMKAMMKQKREKFQNQYGYFQDEEKFSQLKQDLLKTKQKFISFSKTQSKLQQIALLEILNKHPSSWILRMNFIKLPDSFHNMLSNIITLSLIYQNVVEGKYSSSLQMCSDLIKLFQNLRLFLAQGSNYFQTCQKLRQYITPFINSVCNGTFNPLDYFQKSKDEQKKQ